MKNFDIIIRPIITEQSMMDMENNKYTFEVAKTSNKSEIKKAIEAIFSVKVAKVNTMNMTGAAEVQDSDRATPARDRSRGGVCHDQG